MRGRKRKLPADFVPAPWISSSDDEAPQVHRPPRDHHPPPVRHPQEGQPQEVQPHEVQPQEVFDDDDIFIDSGNEEFFQEDPNIEEHGEDHRQQAEAEAQGDRGHLPLEHWEHVPGQPEVQDEGEVDEAEPDAQAEVQPDADADEPDAQAEVEVDEDEEEEEEEEEHLGKPIHCPNYHD